MFSLFWLFPYTHDDWIWGSSEGLYFLRTWFDNYNGRYLGNLIVLLLTRSRLLRTLAMSAVMFGIVYFIERIEKKNLAFWTALLCLIFLPRLVFRQVIAWTSGFANYVTSVFFTLVIFTYINEHSCQEELPEPKAGTCLLLYLLGICNTLIIEHFTVFHILLSSGLVFFYIFTKHTARKDYLSYALGCFSGAAYMFSNSVYHSIADDADFYRTIAKDGIFVRILKNYFGVIFRKAYFNNHYLNMCLFVIILLLYRLYLQKAKPGLMLYLSAFCAATMTVFLAYELICFIRYGSDYTITPFSDRNIFEGIFSGLNLLCMFVLTMIVTYKEESNHRIMLLWGAFVLLIAPLFVVTPIGSRCFFGSYVILILILCELLGVYSQRRIEFNPKWIKYAALVTSLLGFFYYEMIFVDIYRADKMRLHNILEDVQEGKAASELVQLPHEEYLWCATPQKENDNWEKRYKLFYGIPENVDLILEK